MGRKRKFKKIVQQIVESQMESSEVEEGEISCEESAEVEQIKVTGTDKVKIPINQMYKLEENSTKKEKSSMFYTEEELKDLEIKSKTDNSKIIRPLRRKKKTKHCNNFDD